MNPRRLLVLMAAALACATAVFAVVLIPINGADLFVSDTTGSAILALSYVAIGALLVIKRPQNALGWIFFIAGNFNALNALTAEYPFFGAEQGWPGGEVFAWAASWSWVIGAAGFPLILLLFPTGRPPSRRWRWVAWLTGAAVACAVLPVAVTAWPKRAEFVRDVDLDIVGGIAASLQSQVGTLMLGIALLASAVSLIVRFVRSENEERQQLKWLVFGGILTVLIIVTISPAAPVDLKLPHAVETLAAFLALPSIPAAAAIAILKYRLYDIDVIINRALVYGVLTALLLGSYLFIVVALSRILDPVTRDSDIAVAASTLAVAALFRPLRSRVQGFIDRRFYRSKYDSAEALKDFSARLRDETDVDVVSSDVLGVVQVTLQPRHASVWLRAGGIS